MLLPRDMVMLRSAIRHSKKYPARLVLDRFKSSVALRADECDDVAEQPTLVKVPKLPLVGSTWQPYSGIPVPHENNRAFEFWPAMREKFGTFYEYGLPGMGVGLSGTCYVIQDPKEMASILRQEGEFPSGAAEFSWAIPRFLNERNYAVGALMSRGAEWKRMRRFVQSDLLSPTASKRYIPAILEAAETASRGAPRYSNNLNEYLNLASFDMFSNVMMGRIPKVSDPTSHTDPKDVEFCHNVAEALRLSSEFMLSTKEAILNLGLGIKSRKYKQFEEYWDNAFHFAKKQVRDLHQRRLGNTLNEKESNSYANVAFDRHAAELGENGNANGLVYDDVETLVGGLLAAGVDTTGGMLSFKLLHLASSPEVQDKLYHKLQPTLVNGRLTPESLAIPYLTQVMRESHRCGSSALLAPIKTLNLDREVHGHPLPKGSVVLIDTYSTGQQQEHFQDPVREFIPERFSKDAIQARKGTPHQVVDHSFFNGPFSQGARKCPGSRVANLEGHAMVAQWVLDYKMELPSDITHFSQVPYDLQTVTTSTLPAIQFTPRNP